MKLDLAERLHFGVLLPDKGDYISLTLKRDILDKLKITQEEIKEWDLKTDDGQTYNWNPQADTIKEFDFTQAELAMIKDKLKSLNDAKSLDAITYEFYNKFLN